MALCLIVSTVGQQISCYYRGVLISYIEVSIIFLEIRIIIYIDFQ